jgi:hypothetical protein
MAVSKLRHVFSRLATCAERQIPVARRVRAAGRMDAKLMFALPKLGLRRRFEKMRIDTLVRTRTVFAALSEASGGRGATVVSCIPRFR